MVLVAAGLLRLYNSQVLMSQLSRCCNLTAPEEVGAVCEYGGSGCYESAGVVYLDWSGHASRVRRCNPVAMLLGGLLVIFFFACSKYHTPLMIDLNRLTLKLSQCSTEPPGGSASLADLVI